MLSIVLLVIGGSYPEIPDNCRLLKFAFGQDVANVFADCTNERLSGTEVQTFSLARLLRQYIQIGQHFTDSHLVHLV